MNFAILAEVTLRDSHGKYVCIFKHIYFKIPQVCFFALLELENNCRVVEKYACAPKTLFSILAVVTHRLRFQVIPEPS